MRSNGLLIGLSFVAIISCANIFGQNTTPPDSTIFYNPEIIPVITANSTFLEKDGPLNKIDLRKLDLQFHRQYDEIINSIPGVIMQSGALNTNRISIRGMGNRSTFSTTKVKAYLDNIPLTTGIGETTLEDLDLSMVESINVSKGPTDVAYGSNLGGMIHFKTADNISSKKWTLRSQYGSFGTYQLANTLQFNPGKTKLWFGQQYLHSNGFRDNNQYDRWHFYTYCKNEIGRSRISIFANHIDLNAEIPSAINIIDFIDNPKKAADNWKTVNGRESYTRSRLAINHDYTLNDNIALSTILSSQFYNAYEVRPFNILDDDLFNIDLRSFVEDLSLGLSNIKMDTGIEWLWEDYNYEIFESLEGGQGGLNERQGDKRSNFNYFVQIHNRIKNWSWNIGSSVQWLRFNRSNQLQEMQSELNFDFDIYPHFTLGYHGIKNSKLQFIFSRGLSIPNFEESLLPDGSLNPDIAVEKGWNSEIAFQHTDKQNNTQFTVQLYSMYITDLLVARRTAEDAFFSINAGSAWMQGLELSFRQLVRLLPRVQLEIQGDYTYTAHRFDTFVYNQMDFSGNAIPGSAPHQARASIHLKNPIINFQTEFYFMDSYPINDINSINNQSFLLCYVQLYKELESKQGIQTMVSIGVNNAFDVRYASMTAINARSFGNSLPRYYYPGRFRNFFVTFVQKI